MLCNLIRFEESPPDEVTLLVLKLQGINTEGEVEQGVPSLVQANL